MSRAAPKSPMVRRGSKERGRRVERVLVLTWNVSRDAAAARGLAAASGPGSPVLELQVPWPGAVRGVEAGVLDGGSRKPITAPGRGEWVHDGGLWHLDISGTLSVSLREEGGAVRVLYARCDLPARLGLEGGRYEFEVATVVRT